MSETTDKTRVTDWNAWLGDVPGEKPHFGCRWCHPLPVGCYVGMTIPSVCGRGTRLVTGRNEDWTSDRWCDDCRRMALEGEPCSPGCRP